MSFIKTISYEESESKLRKLYDRVKGPNNNVDNIMMAHSLRPHSMEGHMALYKNVLHHAENTLPKWLLETLGVYVSLLNKCDYCVDHHFHGLKKLLNNNEKSEKVKMSLISGEYSPIVNKKQSKLLNYAQKLTLFANSVSDSDIEHLRNAGYSDGEILEANQVIAYFNYANRTVLGLGVNTTDDELGLSPSGDCWEHK